MPVFLPNSKELIKDGVISLLEDNIKVALLTAGYPGGVPSGACYWSALRVHEAVGPGYLAGGKLLKNKRSRKDKTFTADSVSWRSSTLKARYVAVYKCTGDAGTSPVIAIVDTGSEQSSICSDFTLLIGPRGLFLLP